jgi:predicted RNase H-like HicB family nuclease
MEVNMKLCVHIKKDHEGRFVAYCPSLPGCKTGGQTREEARDNLDDAIRGYIASLDHFEPDEIVQDVVEI